MTSAPVPEGTTLLDRAERAGPTPVARQVLGRAAALAAAALVLAALVLPWRPPTLCVLRAVTGLPCPACGGTTAMVALGRADLVAAFQASPLVTLGAPLWVLWPRLRPAVDRWRRARGRRWGIATVLLVAALSELWQLHRLLG